LTNFIPIFPLPIIVFPEEKLNLHIFEPRYKQLIIECFEKKKHFGIPTIIENKISDFGTLIEIKEITTVYGDGSMDIKTQGLQIFNIIEVIKDIPEKLYYGAIVNYPEIIMNGRAPLMLNIISSIKDFYLKAGVQKNFGKPDELLNSYDLAHYIGFTLNQEYEFLCLLQELHRQEYIKRHLAIINPQSKETDALKNKIMLNGHFKNLNGFEF